jgi:acyl-ACP thioesterase
MEKMIIAKSYPLTTGDFDQYNQLKPYAVLNYFQDVASLHSQSLHAGYPDLLAVNKMWILLKNKFVLYQQPSFFKDILLTTWPLPTDKIYYPRAYQIKSDQNVLLGEGMSLWSIINLKTNSLSREAWFLGDSFHNRSLFVFQKKIPEFENEIFIKNYQVTNIDLDHNFHMNNANYANLIYDVLAQENKLPVLDCEIHYLKQTKLNDIIRLYQATNNDSIFVYGKDEQEKLIFSSEIKLINISQ